MNVPMNYVDPPDVPEGMTLEAYRRGRLRPAPRRSLLTRLLRRPVAVTRPAPARP
ncbi:MAG: hypothetical protein ACR2K9_06560 [Solirubrobacteraceae bacterium]